MCINITLSDGQTDSIRWVGKLQVIQMVDALAVCVKIYILNSRTYTNKRQNLNTISLEFVTERSVIVLYSTVCSTIMRTKQWLRIDVCYKVIVQ